MPQLKSIKQATTGTAQGVSLRWQAGTQVYGVDIYLIGLIPGVKKTEILSYNFQLREREYIEKIV